MAGHLQLGRIIYLYDDNHISIDGSTDLAFTEDRTARFEAYGWHVQKVEDGNDVEAIDKAIQAAKTDPRPSMIMCRTTIGFGAPNDRGLPKRTANHSATKNLNAAKENLGWPTEPRFFIPEDVLAFYRKAVDQGREREIDWKMKLDAYKNLHPNLGSEVIPPLGWEIAR